MDLEALRNRVANATGLNPSSTSDQTKIDAWINQAYQHISGVNNWPWLVKQGTIVTSTDITTGTVSINDGSTDLTFSSAPSVSVANDWMIQFSDSDDWYDISSHTASSTSATLASAYNAGSNLSGGTYTLRRIYYSLPSDLDRVIDIRQMRTDLQLEPVDVRFLDSRIPDPDVTGTPTHFAVYGLDTNKYWRLSTYPTPEDKMNLLVRYTHKITALSANSDEPVIPTKWHNVLVHCALYLYGYMFIDDTRLSEAKSAYEMILKEMERNASPIPGQTAKPMPWDQKLRRSRIGIIFPNNIE